MLLGSNWESSTSLCMNYTLEIKEKDERAVSEEVQILALS